MKYLLSDLDLKKKYNGIEVEDVTNEYYKKNVEKCNDEIRKRQKKYYEAYNNASKVSVG